MLKEIMPDYKAALNEAQLEAVTAPEGNTLVVAGAGSGKTRAIVYRLAWLVEQGVAPESILLLTFTRKAAREMLGRAEELLRGNPEQMPPSPSGATGGEQQQGPDLRNLSGGTFHAFAFGVLRAFRPAWLAGRPFTLMDTADINQAIKECKNRLKAGKKDSSFPKTQTIVSLLSKSRNKEIPLPELLRQESFHLLPHAEALEAIGQAYTDYKRERGLMDYDDLLFELEDLLRANSHAAITLRSRFRHILVDEYQDTNLVQARIVRLLSQAPEPGLPCASVMAVGDEAQSIYAFRGANVRNIMDFPDLFPDTRIIRLEQNYRSTQPILDIANNILANASESFKKHLFTHKKGGELPRIVRPVSDSSEAELVVSRIGELLTSHRPQEIAVLFRAGFHSYALENALRKHGIPFRKYGGLRFIEAAHVKDLLAFARLAINPLDYPAFGRIAQMHKGIGPKTMASLHQAIIRNDPAAIQKAFKRFPAFLSDLKLVEELASQNLRPEQFFEALLAWYRPRLEENYPDDWPSRLQGLEEILRMTQVYENLDLFVADMALDSAEPEEAEGEDCITLSTVHSAKGLEWSAVLLLDTVEDRFPSRHAQARPEDYEEERRLFYVACTRARQILEFYAPGAIYSHNGGGLTNPSPFLRELPAGLFETRLERQGRIETVASPKMIAKSPQINASEATPLSGDATYCRHRIFGRGKIMQRLDNNRIQVKFPGFGLKTILADYLIAEE